MNLRLSMNRASCGSQTRGPDRASVRRSGSWSQCVRKSERWLSMNHPSPGLWPPSPRLAGRGQGEGCQSSSWCQRIRENERGLPMNQRNIQHRTPNAEHRMASRILAHFGVRCSMFDVGRSMFFLHSGASMRDQNSGDSLLEESVRVRGHLARWQLHIAIRDESLMPNLNPEFLQLDSGDMCVGVANVDGFLMPIHKEALHAVVGMLPGVVGRRSVIRLRPGIDPVAVAE